LDGLRKQRRTNLNGKISSLRRGRNVQSRLLQSHALYSTCQENCKHFSSTSISSPRTNELTSRSPGLDSISFSPTKYSTFAITSHSQLLLVHSASFTTLRHRKTPPRINVTLTSGLVSSNFAPLPKAPLNSSPPQPKVNSLPSSTSIRTKKSTRTK